MRLKKRQNCITAREIRATSHNFHAAFTLTELLAVVALVAILGVMMLPSHHSKPSKDFALRIRCINNLKNLGLAFRIYATDNHDRFPWEIPNEKDEIHINYLSDPSDYIRGLSNEISTPKILICPAAKREEATNWIQFSRTNLSYFISPDASQTFPNSFLAGDRNITNENGKLPSGLRTFARTNYTAGWDETIHKSKGNAAMADGSVQQLSAARLREQLRNTGQSNQNIKFSIP